MRSSCAMATLVNRRLLALCGALVLIFLVYILNINVLITCLLCGGVTVFMYVANVARSGRKIIIPIKSLTKLGSRRKQNGERPEAVRNDGLVSPVRPHHRNKLHVTEKGYELISGIGNSNYNGPRLVNETLQALSPILAADALPTKRFEFCPEKSPTAASATTAPPFSKHSDNSIFCFTATSLARSPLSSVHASSDLPVKNLLPNATQKNPPHQHGHMTTTTPQQPNYTKPVMFPLLNRHYPTHQPDYTRTSMGILPASSIFYGDGMASSIGSLRKAERVRTHSPVTIKIARPDNRRSASPLFRRLSLEHSYTGSPLHKDAVLAALKEKRKRLINEEQDDTSSVASSVAGGGIFAKRRRLENDSCCSTSSQVSTHTSHSGQVNGEAPSESSIEGAPSPKMSTLWTGIRGLQSRTPRNPISSSVSSSKRAALANMRKKRILLQPAKPESSPSKKSCLPDPEDSPEPPDIIPHTDRPKSGTDYSKSVRRNKEPELNSERDVGSKDVNGLEAGTPTTAARKYQLGSRLKTPKLKTLGDHVMKNSSPPGEYTAADLQEDRHMAKQRVNYILESLKDGEVEPETNKPSDQQKSVVGAMTLQVTSTSAESVTSTISSPSLLKLSKMNTLPVSAVQTGHLLLLNSKSDVAKASKDTPPPAVSSEAPAASSQQASANSLGAPLKSTLTGGFTVLDSAKAGTTSSSVGQQSKTTSKSATSEKNPLLKGILTGSGSNSDAVPQSTGAQTGGNLGMAAGKLGGIQQAGLSLANSVQNTSGLFKQAAPSGFSTTASTGLQQTSTTGSSLFQQQNTTTTSSFPSQKATQRAGSGLQFGDSVTKPTIQDAMSTVPLQFGTLNQIPQSSTSMGFQLNTNSSTTASSTNLSGSFPSNSTSTLKKDAQRGSPFVFGSTLNSSATAKTAASSLSLRGGTEIFGNQSLPSTVVSGLFNPSTTAAGSLFGSATSTTTAVPQSFAPTFGQPGSSTTSSFNPSTAATGSPFGRATSTTTVPSFTPALGQSVSSTTSSFNFTSMQPQSTGSTSTSSIPQFKPVFGAPSHLQTPQTQPVFQFGAVNTSQPVVTSASTGGFTFNASAPSTTSSSVFGAVATPSPFQSSTPSMTGAPFQQLSTPTPSFGAAATQQATPFGGPTARQSMFGGQATGSPSTSTFNFGTQANSQPNSSVFAFGQQPSQPAGSNGSFQFGQAPGSNQQATPSLGSVNTPSKPPSFNFGAGVGASSGFGTPAPSAVPSFGSVTPTSAGSFSLGSSGAMAPKRMSRLTRHRQTRRR